MSDTLHHVPQNSPWPLSVASGILMAGFGTLPLLYGLPVGWIMLIMGAFLFFLGLGGWMVSQAKEQIAQVAGTAHHEAPGASKWFVAFLIVSEVFLFGALFAAYFFLHDRDVLKTQSFLHFFTHQGEILHVVGPVVYLNTILLVSSSFTLHFAEHLLKHGKLLGFRILLGVTVVLGLLFMGGQVVEYINFIQEGITWDKGPYLTLFFTITAIHGLHVTAGALILGSMFAGSFFGQFSPQHHSSLSVVSIYWHFVDVVWLFLLATLYFRLL